MKSNSSDMISASDRSNPISTESATVGEQHSIKLTELIDVSAIYAMVYRSRYLIAAIVIGCVLLAALGSFLLTPIYRAVAKVQIDQETSRVIGTEERGEAASIQDADRFLQTQVDVIKSRSLAIAVSKDLGLDRNDQFLERMNLTLDDEVSRFLTPAQIRRNQIVDALLENLSIELPVDSRIVSIYFDSPDQQLAVDVANSYAKKFIELNLERKFDTSLYARQFLKKQLEEAAVRLEQSERDALEYARQTQIIDISSNKQDEDGGGQLSLSGENLVALNRSYAGAQAKRIEAEQRWRASNGQSLMSQPEVLGNPAIQRMIEERATARAEYEEQLQRRKSDFPLVQQAKAKIDELDQQIATLAGGIRNTLKTSFDAAEREERALAAKIDSLKAETLVEQTKSVQLSILQRQSANHRALYDLLLRRYNELNAEAGVQANNIVIVDDAEIQLKPISPNILLNIIISFFGGIALSMAVVFVRENFFNVVITTDDVSRQLGLSALGAVPYIEDGKDFEEELQDNKSDLSEAFSSIRSQLMLSSPGGVPKVVMFTSAQQGEGKSSSCHAVAVALARIGKAVLVVDLDLRRPRVHHIYNVKNDVGISNVLVGNLDVNAVKKPTGNSLITVIPSGPKPPNPAELLAGSALRDILVRLGSEFDVILVDSPPMLALADAVEVSAVSDGCIFVIESGRSQVSALRTSLARLRANGAHILGGLLTKFDAKSAGYQYSYAYKYDYHSTDSVDS